MLLTNPAQKTERNDQNKTKENTLQTGMSEWRLGNCKSDRFLRYWHQPHAREPSMTKNPVGNRSLIREHTHGEKSLEYVAEAAPNISFQQ